MKNTVPVHVAAVVNLTKRTGTIEHVTPLPGSLKAAPEARNTRLAIRTSVSGNVSREYAGQFKPVLCRLRKEDETGLVDAVLILDTGTLAIELLIDGKPVARFVVGPPPGAVQGLQIRAARVPREEDTEGLSAGPQGSVILSWKEPSSRLGGGLRYIVQASTDGGATWKTLVLSATEPRANINPGDLAEAEKVRFRVLSTNGIAYTEKTSAAIRVADLLRSSGPRRAKR